MSPADQVLFDQWITRRDASAFTRLAEKYAAMVYAVGRRITGNAHDAEDVAQAAFETLASQRRAPRVHLGAWLHRVATYRALNHLKAESRRTDREARYDRERPKHAEIGWDDIYELVDEAIAALPDKQRDVVVAHYLEGKTHDAIARELGVSRPAVTQRVQAGVAGIRAALGKRGVAVPLAALGALLVNGAEASVPIALAAQLGKIALSGYVGKTGTGIGLWQGMMASMGMAKGWAVGAMVVVAAGLGIAGLLSGGGDTESPPAGRDAFPQANTTPQATPVIAESPIPERVTESQSDIAAPVTTFTAATQGARVFGKVIDTNGNPVAGIQVYLRGSEDIHRGASWPTEDDGTFEFPNVLPATSCWVVAAHNESGKERRSDQFGLTPLLSGETHEITLTVYDGLFTGRVLDERGRPVSGIAVLADPDGWWYRGTLPREVTGEDGRFRMAGVVKGKYEMVLTPENGSSIETGVKAVSDGVGVRSEINLVFKAPTGGTFHGRVTNEAGDGLGDAYVRCNLTVQSATIAWALTDADGYYEIVGVADGPNVLLARHRDYEEKGLGVVVPDGEAIDIVLQRRSEVRGQVVHHDTGEPIREFEIYAAEPISEKEFWVVTEDWRERSDSEGRFSEVMRSGAQTLRARAKGFGETSQAVEVPVGDVLEDLRIALKPSHALRGLVTNGETDEPVSGARIYQGVLPLVPNSPAAFSDETGQFVLEEVSADGGLISVTHPSYAPAWAQLEAGQAEVVIAMHAGVEVTGTVSVNGVPVEGARVTADAPDRTEHRQLASRNTDKNGQFKIPGMPTLGINLKANLEVPGMPQGRTMYFQPDDTWRTGREPVHFDFVQSDADLVLTVLRGTQPQPGCMIWAARELEGGFREDMLLSSDLEGRAVFYDLSEGLWDLQIHPPGVRTTRDAIPMEADMIANQTLMLQRDLDRPDVELESVMSIPNADAEPQESSEAPEDGEQVSVPLVLESRGDAAE
jgi:RNA polymerase sigma factor (sigma-70 family)